jgi:hypothetical protein
MDRETQLYLSLPPGGHTVQRPVANLDGGSDKQGVVYHGLPSREAIGFEAGGRELDVPANLAPEPSFARTYSAFHHVNADRRQG